MLFPFPNHPKPVEKTEAPVQRPSDPIPKRTRLFCSTCGVSWSIFGLPDVSNADPNLLTLLKMAIDNGSKGSGFFRYNGAQCQCGETHLLSN